MATEDFFVGIYDPTDVRRELLECSKEVIKSLQAHDALERIRVHKLKSTKEMKVVMDELDLLVAKLQEKLPETHLRKAVENYKKPRRVALPRPEDKLSKQLERLEAQLKSVEKDLSSLK